MIRMLLIDNHKVFFTGSGSFVHAGTCGCDRIYLDDSTWFTLSDIRVLYEHNSMGLGIDEFTVGLGLATFADKPNDHTT